MKVRRVGGRFRQSWVLAIVWIFLATWAQARQHAPSRSSQTGLLGTSGATFTLPAPQGSWTLIAYGDTRFTDPSDQVDTSPAVRQKLIEKIAEEKPQVVLISGDVPFHGGDANDYAVYESETAAWRDEGIRVFPALGNHELYSGEAAPKCLNCLENWWNAFPKLRGRRWYSVHFGPAYIITLDSNLNLLPGSRQAKWLAEQLKSLPSDVRYVFISLHHPPIADPVVNDSYHNARPNEQAVAKQLEAAAKHTKAKFIVIAGHIHNYERFKEGGVEFLVAGGGGATPYQVVRSPKDLYTSSTFPNYHYVKFVYERGMLKATMYRLDEQGNFDAADTFTVGPGKVAIRPKRGEGRSLSATR